ncbi:MAG: class I SAM-dependent methyltransferase [Myxococcales bacterium]|nr:class I SAM-dependent methyltransferase [Myxococcales bacterium]
MLTNVPAMDLTSPQVWDRYYDQHVAPSRPLPAMLSPRDPQRRRLIRLLRQVLPRDPGGRLLEVGCGGSECLPFFALEFGYEIWGIDYSPAGAALARRNLELLGLSGHIVQGDFLDPETLRGERFSAVVSFGVIEHSDEPERFIARKAQLVQPGGLVVTQVPNLLGYAGRLLRLSRPEVYRQHVPISAEQLHQLHADAGLVPVLSARYFGTLDLWQLNPWLGWYARLPVPLPRLLPKAITAANLALGAVLERLPGPPESRFFSPDVIAVYRKPA